ncbi:ubiquitin-like protein 3 isoform X2 [Gallus gallus]|uniref:ubiquitin-like protein 3 isoform X2 n=1 Tax=Gallus gallus TaxID=9031 RepID=UPI001F0028CD|nr:ubiquitin-like protein 3 isoform X2 [Gallus gallus]
MEGKKEGAQFLASVLVLSLSVSRSQVTLRNWEEEQVSSPNILRLIYQGRFLHGNVTLGALKLPFGKTTVMHLVARETLPEPNSQGQRNREKTGESNCCVIL